MASLQNKKSQHDSSTVLPSAGLHWNAKYILILGFIKIISEVIIEKVENIVVL